MTGALVVIGGLDGGTLPVLFAPDARTAERVIEFFTAHLRNPNTRKAYARAVSRFAMWCTDQGIHVLGQVRPVHVAAYIGVAAEKGDLSTVRKY